MLRHLFRVVATTTGLMVAVLVAQSRPVAAPETANAAASAVRVLAATQERTAPTSTIAPPTSSAVPTSSALPSSSVLPGGAVTPPVAAQNPGENPGEGAGEAVGIDGLTNAELRQAVLERISYPWQERLPGWTVEFRDARKGFRGSTFPAEQRIEIYRRPGLQLEDYVHVTAHELGHAVDVTLLDDADHERWNVTRGRAADFGWWVASGASDFSSGAGDWAECFAWFQQPTGRFYSELGLPPSPSQLDELRSLVS